MQYQLKKNYDSSSNKKSKKNKGRPSKKKAKTIVKCIPPSTTINRFLEQSPQRFAAALGPIPVQVKDKVTDEGIDVEKKKRINWAKHYPMKMQKAIDDWDNGCGDSVDDMGVPLERNRLNMKVFAEKIKIPLKTLEK